MEYFLFSSVILDSTEKNLFFVLIELFFQPTKHFAPPRGLAPSRTQTWLHNCVGEICVLVLPWLYDLFEPCDLVGQNLGSPAVAVERERGRGPLNSGPGLLARHGLGYRFPWSPERAGFRWCRRQLNYRSWSHHRSDVAGAVATRPVRHQKLTRKTWKAETETGAWQKGNRWWMDHGSKQQSKPPHARCNCGHSANASISRSVIA